jgi:Glycosyl transferase family 8
MTLPERHDCAVAFCCDRNFFPLALFMIRQIAFHNPARRFDFVIASQEDLQVPDWAQEFAIRMHRTGVLPGGTEGVRFKGSLSPYFRIMLPRELGVTYRRILYLDSDMFVEGGDINRILNADIGSFPLAAARDAPMFYTQNFLSDEFRVAGMPPRKSANTGTMLIDTSAFAEQEVERRCFDMLERFPHAVTTADQSLFNLALHGEFAELSPAWNWQLSGRLPLMTHNFPVFMRHFISATKPHNSTKDRREARFHQAYAEFFGRYFPDDLAAMPPKRSSVPLRFKGVARLMFWHLQARKLSAEILASFTDPYQVKF